MVLNNQDDGYSEDNDTPYQKQSNNLDKLLLGLGLIVSVNAVNNVYRELSPKEKELLKNDVKPQQKNRINKIHDTTPSNIDIEAYLTFFTDEEIQNYKNIAEQLKQQGRIEDPRTVENIAYNNASRISETVSQFGAIESTKQSYLGVMVSNSNDDHTLLIPWITAGAHTCGDCEDLANAGPYLPTNYPAPPHYKCECLPGTPVPIFIDSSVKGIPPILINGS